MVLHHIWWRLGGRGPGLSDLIILFSLSYRMRCSLVKYLSCLEGILFYIIFGGSWDELVLLI